MAPSFFSFLLIYARFFCQPVSRYFQHINYNIWIKCSSIVYNYSGFIKIFVVMRFALQHHVCAWFICCRWNVVTEFLYTYNTPCDLRNECDKALKRWWRKMRTFHCVFFFLAIRIFSIIGRTLFWAMCDLSQKYSRGLNGDGVRELMKA